MKKLVLIIITIIAYTLPGFSQHNCSNPTPVVICPDILLTGETNLGMIDDGPALCNIPGEDLVYRITVTNGAQKLFVSLLNATMPLNLILEENNCGAICTSLSVPAGNSNLNFTVNPALNYYLWVDAGGTVTYDIAIGADTGQVMINIPNTQGNLQLDSSMCNTPVFQPSKPFFQVNYNGDYMIHPMTLSPLFSAGTMCVTVFFKNTTGIEGIRRFEFDFNPAGYQNVSTPDSIAGFYNAGNWRSSNSGTTWTYLFDDLAGIGKGDFTGTPNSCLMYEFCFTVTPLSNDPLLTNVDVLIFSDGFGAGYNGVVGSGCCPSPVPNCLGYGGGPSVGTAQAFGFGFADPGGPLPIELMSFTAEVVHHEVVLKWTTATEVNNDYFSIEKSKNGIEWLLLDEVDGAGTSSVHVYYVFKDENPFDGTSYYRLKQTDYDGQSAYSDIVTVSVENSVPVEIFPLPADHSITIKSSIVKELRVQLYDIHGIRFYPYSNYEENSIVLNTASLVPGLYMILILEGDRVITKQKMVIAHSK